MQNFKPPATVATPAKKGNSIPLRTPNALPPAKRKSDMMSTTSPENYSKLYEAVVEEAVAAGRFDNAAAALAYISEKVSWDDNPDEDKKIRGAVPKVNFGRLASE